MENGANLSTAFRLTLLTLAVAACALLASVGSGPRVVSASDAGLLLGDADCNSHIDEFDALAAAQYFAELDLPFECIDLADVNCDGEVDLLDVIELLRYRAGLPPDDIPEDCSEIGSVNGLPPLNFRIDQGIDVPDDMPGIEGGPPRPLGAMEDEDGNVSWFVENEILIGTDDLDALQDFLDRWNATLIKTINPADVGLDLPMIHLVRLDPSGVDLDALAADLKLVNAFANGDFGLSSQDAAELFAVAAGEAADGMQIDLNWVAQGAVLEDNLDQRDLDDGPPGARNPFSWTYMSRGSVQDIGVADAWRAMNAAGKLDNEVDVAILDGGFAPNLDFPPGFTMLGQPNVPNPASCTAGSSCPWHATIVTAAAMGVPDNGYGVAGPAGPVAHGILVQSPGADIFTYVEYIFQIIGTAIEHPDVLNISAGIGIPREACLTLICLFLDSVTTTLHVTGTLLVAAAGNDGEDVDKEKCIIFGTICYEKTTHIPCELAFVICVGGLAPDSTAKDPQSNYGSDGGVDIFGPMSQWHTPTPDEHIKFDNCGTSCASPFVAGVAALIQAADPDLSTGGVADYLLDYAHTISGDPKVQRWVNAYASVIAVLGNEPPELHIEMSNGTFNGGQPTSFLASATDPEDRPSPAIPYAGLPAVQWTSSIDGNFGNGINFEYLLSYGTHTITAVATDSFGWSITDTRTITLLNDPPNVTIVSPTDGSTKYVGQLFQLRGASTDLNKLTGKLADSEVEWFSAPAGDPNNRTSLGTGHLLSDVGLPQGQYIITFKGTDEAGASDEASINLTVLQTPADYPPTAIIDSVIGPNCGTTYQWDLTGHATDQEDGNLTGGSLVWTKTVSGNTTFVGTGATASIPTSDVPAGTDFTITLTATDSNNGIGTDTYLIDDWDGCFI